MYSLGKIKKLFDSLNNELDLNQQMDYYFDKWIFRGAFIFLILLFAFFILSDGFQQKVYLNCPLEVGSCKNPIYKQCDNWIDSYIENYSHSSIKSALQYCNQEYLIGGTIIGEPPSKIYDNFWFIVFGSLILAFIVNHFVHNRNREIKI